MTKKSPITNGESIPNEIKRELRRQLEGEPEVKRKPRDGYYERRSFSRPWKMLECKKPAKREATSEVTKAQNTRLADASRLAKQILSDSATRAQWEAKYRIAHRDWTKHAKPIQTLRQFIISHLMRGTYNN